MERLTAKFKDGGVFILPSVLPKLSPMKSEIIEKLADYEDAEEQGLLLRLPCPIGTPVYTIEQDCGGDTLDCRCMDCDDCRYLYRYVEERTFYADMCDCIGKIVFLTREEAEKALADMGV